MSPLPPLASPALSLNARTPLCIVGTGGSRSGLPMQKAGNFTLYPIGSGQQSAVAVGSEPNEHQTRDVVIIGKGKRAIHLTAAEEDGTLVARDLLATAQEHRGRVNLVLAPSQGMLRLTAGGGAREQQLAEAARDLTALAQVEDAILRQPVMSLTKAHVFFLQGRRAGDHDLLIVSAFDLMDVSYEDLRNAYASTCAYKVIGDPGAIACEALYTRGAKLPDNRRGILNLEPYSSPVAPYNSTGRYHLNRIDAWKGSEQTVHWLNGMVALDPGFILRHDFVPLKDLAEFSGEI